MQIVGSYTPAQVTARCSLSRARQRADAALTLYSFSFSVSSASPAPVIVASLPPAALAACTLIPSAGALPAALCTYSAPGVSQRSCMNAMTH